MDRHEGPQTALTIALLRGLNITIIMDRYEEPHGAITISLLSGHYLAILMVHN
jgi:hypothetical protein